MANPLLDLVNLLGLQLVTYTPLSDLAAGSNVNQVVWGRTGNDTLLPYEQYGPFNDFLGSYDDGKSQFDVILGDSEFPQIEEGLGLFRTWSDTFILGDWRKSYFVQDSLLTLGLGDFALLPDFQPTKDTVELHGQSSDYTLLDLGGLGLLAYNQPVFPGLDFLKIPNIIAVILPADALGPLDLTASYFKYVGSAPPPVVESKIIQYGGPAAEITDSITVDSDGNIFIAGTTTGYLGSDPFGQNSGFRDIYIRKYSPDGTLIASLQYGGSGNDEIFDLTTDKSGNVYAVGSFNGDGIGEPVQGAIGFDAWIGCFKGDLSGTNWIKRIDNDTITQQPGELAGSYNIDLDSEGNLYVSGVVNIPTPLGSEIPLSTDNAIAKYSPDGTMIWFHQYGWDGVADFDESYNSATDLSGNTYLTGFTTSGWAKDPNWSTNTTSLGIQAQGYDAWISKSDKNGNPLWIRDLQTPDFDWIWGIDTDSMGNIYVAGVTLGSLLDTVDTSINAGSYDSFVAKYDPSGSLLWLNQIGTPKDDQAFTLQVSSDDNVIFAGFTQGSFTETPNAGGFDAFLVNLDSGNGKVKWSQQFGTPDYDGLLELAFDNDHIYALGNTNGSLGAFNNGSIDAWLAKLDLSTGTILEFSDESGLSSRSEKILLPAIQPPSSPDNEVLQQYSLLLESFSALDPKTLLSYLGLDSTKIDIEIIQKLLSNVSSLPPYNIPSFPPHTNPSLPPNSPIEDKNKAPTSLELSSSLIDENIPDSSLIAILSSTDPSTSPQTFTYSLVPGTGDTDNLFFSIVNNELRIIRSPDYEQKSSYTIRLRTTDQEGLIFERTVQLSVNDLVELNLAVGNVLLKNPSAYFFRFEQSNKIAQALEVQYVAADGSRLEPARTIATIVGEASGLPAGFSYDNILAQLGDGKQEGRVEFLLRDLRSGLTTPLQVVGESQSGFSLEADGILIRAKEAPQSVLATSLDSTIMVDDNEIIGRNLSRISGNRADFQCELFRESDFNNIIGFYLADLNTADVIDPITGKVVATRSGESSAYCDAAVRSSVWSGTTDNQTQLSFNSMITIGAGLDLKDYVLLPYIQVSGGTEIYVSGASKNSDGFSHIQRIGINSFGFEDLRGGGDADFDDMIIVINSLKVLT